MRSILMFLSLKIGAAVLVVSLAYAVDKAKQPVQILILGDSITDGYGVEKEKAYPSLVESKLRKDGFNVLLINGGVSGSTSASATSRMRWFLKSKPDRLLLALGGNDGLRGLDLVSFKKNMKEVIRLAKENKIEVWLAGMQIPPNYGLKYTKKFAEIYQEIAREEKIPLLPFLLEGVAGRSEFNQPDAIHPNEQGHQIIAKNVAQFMRKNLKK